MDIAGLLELSAREHHHLCPRQVLGVRIGIGGLHALSFHGVPARKRILAICETDGCFVDGVIAATGCTVGHRTLRIANYGKVAATFIDTWTERAVRLAPAPNARYRAARFLPDAPSAYIAQLKAYQVIPENELLDCREVSLVTPVGWILSPLGHRVSCDACGEEIINQREVHQWGQTLCLACAGQAYYCTSRLELAAKLNEV